MSEISDHHYNVDAPIEEHFGHLNGIKRALTCIKIGSNAFQAESRHQDAVRKVPTCCCSFDSEVAVVALRSESSKS